MQGAKLRKHVLAERGHQIAVYDLGVSLIRFGRDAWFGIVPKPSLKILTQCHLRQLDIGADVDLVQKPSEFGLGIALVALYGMPFLAALAVGVAAKVEHDSPGGLAALSEMTFHGFIPSILVCKRFAGPIFLTENNALQWVNGLLNRADQPAFARFRFRYALIRHASEQYRLSGLPEQIGSNIIIGFRKHRP